MLSGALFFWFSYLLLIFFVGRGGNIVWLAVYALFIVVVSYVPDPILFSLPVLVALATYRITLPPGHPRGLPGAVPPGPHLSLIFVPLGFLPLVKGTLLILAAGIAALCSVMFYRRKQYFLACSAIAAPALTALVLWVMVGQPVSALPQYLRNMFEIISGYTEAMALAGKAFEVAVYLAIASVLLVSIALSSADDPGDSRIFLMACYALIGFLALKAGFVRHDIRAGVASMGLVIISILSATLFNRVFIAVLISISLLVWGYINSTHVDSFSGAAFERISDTYRGAWKGVQARLTLEQPFLGQYTKALEEIRRASPLPDLQGPTDIFGYQQSSLLASGNIWAPRPVLQSYSAYTPRLAKLTEAYFRSERSPQNMVFRVETIDNRYPSLDEGLIWPILMENYSVERFLGAFAVLRKTAATPGPMVERPFDHVAEHRLGESVLLPRPVRPVYAELTISPTPLGRVLSFFWKPTRLLLTVTLNDGTQREYRIVSGMTETGFVLSPLIESAREFVLLATTGTRFLADKLVTTLTVRPESENSWFWREAYTLRLRSLGVSDQLKDISKFGLFAQTVGADRLAVFQRSSVECAGSIDGVNGISPVPPLVRTRGTLTVSGWTAVSPQSGVVADEVFVTLTGTAGSKRYLSTVTVPRADVSSYFGQPGLVKAAFESHVDVSNLRGRYTLGVSRLYKQSLQECVQFRIPIQIGG